MIVAIHQPDFFPWLGMFDKIIKSDLFVLYDSCRNDSKLGWTKRVQLTKGYDVRWLGFAMHRVHRNAEGYYPRLCEHRIRDFEKNRLRHLRIIEAEYRYAPFFDKVMPYLQELYAYHTEILTEFNIYCILSLCRELYISRPMIRSSTLHVGSAKNEAHVEIIEKVGGNIYLSGQGARAYMIDEVYRKHGIEVRYQQFTHPTYPQFNRGDFVPGLSIIDALMNIGFEGVRAILQ